MCEDFPCCGHEYGDCEGQKYGSDEAIVRREHERYMRLWDAGLDPEDPMYNDY